MFKPVLSLLLLTLAACGSLPNLGAPIHSDDFNPQVKLQGPALLNYKETLADCQKQTLKRYDLDKSRDLAVIGLRKCLIDKGYVLLS